MRMPYIMPAAALLMLLTGCAGDPVFDARACPVEKTYTAEEQKQMAADLPKTPSSIQTAIVDYGKLRDKARACRGQKVPG